uniref:Hyaluronoglucosaminidase n=1 Tax=Angiostrongylus cantonensis TaxID=6313 RepID=A0A0K0D8L8_ANGCA
MELQITSPIHWSSVIQKNADFINSILARAYNHGVAIGIYTNFYDWRQIAGHSTTSNVLLWYWNVYGVGSSSESPANFNDFRPFGSWTVPLVKQFGQVENMCKIEVNR